MSLSGNYWKPLTWFILNLFESDKLIPIPFCKKTLVCRVPILIGLWRASGSIHALCTEGSNKNKCQIGLLLMIRNK